MQLFVKTLAGSTVVVDVDQTETIDSLKSKLSTVQDIPADQQCLQVSGKQLDSITLGSLGEGSVVDMVMPLKGGGKVHGSLARAGKVKGQTPKVEKQDKKRLPTGRAKKRLQYYRRFTAVSFVQLRSVPPTWWLLF